MLNEKEKRERIYGKEISREEALAIIRKSPNASIIFEGFKEEAKEKFLSFIRGKTGLRILYDSYFRRIMNPRDDKTRLEDFLSSLLHEKVEIADILDREGSQIAAEETLVIMDIIVRFSDGSLADIEVQKVGFNFPGERADCYCADMIMRQYVHLRNLTGDKFTYSSMRPVYLFVLIETSPLAMQKAAPAYIHRKVISYDSGAAITNLEKIMFISLDTFRKTVQDITDRESAWLTFFSCDDIDKINELVDKYPEFLKLYAEIREFRKRPEEVISMFSEALKIMDRNTAVYMVEQAQMEAEQERKRRNELETELLEANTQLEKKDIQLEEKDRIIAELRKALAEK